MKLLVLLSIALSSLFTFASNERGNGGYTIYCPEHANKFTLLDLYEEYKRTDFERKEFANLDQAFKYVMEIIAVNDPARAHKYNKIKENIWNANNIYELDGSTKIDAPRDLGEVTYPNDCQLRRTINFKKKLIYKDEKMFTIEKDSWRQLSFYEQAFAVLHEIVYRESYLNDVINMRHKTSELIRTYVGDVASQRVSHLSQIELAKVYRKEYGFDYISHNKSKFHIIDILNWENIDELYKMPRLRVIPPIILGKRNDTIISNIGRNFDKNIFIRNNNQVFVYNCYSDDRNILNLKLDKLSDYYQSKKAMRSAPSNDNDPFNFKKFFTPLSDDLFFINNDKPKHISFNLCESKYAKFVFKVKLNFIQDYLNSIVDRILASSFRDLEPFSNHIKTRYSDFLIDDLMPAINISAKFGKTSKYDYEKFLRLAVSQITSAFYGDSLDDNVYEAWSGYSGMAQVKAALLRIFYSEVAILKKVKNIPCGFIEYENDSHYYPLPCLLDDEALVSKEFFKMEGFMYKPYKAIKKKFTQHDVYYNKLIEDQFVMKKHYVYRGRLDLDKEDVIIYIHHVENLNNQLNL